MQQSKILTMNFSWFAPGSWNNVHLRQRRRPHYVQLAGQWEAKHQDRQADCWLQHFSEGRHPGSDRQCTWSGGLSHVAHSEFMFVSRMSGNFLCVSVAVCFLHPSVTESYRYSEERKKVLVPQWEYFYFYLCALVCGLKSSISMDYM